STLQYLSSSSGIGTPVTEQRTNAPGRTTRKSPSRYFTSASPFIGGVGALQFIKRGLPFPSPTPKKSVRRARGNPQHQFTNRTKHPAHTRPAPPPRPPAS